MTGGGFFVRSQTRRRFDAAGRRAYEALPVPNGTVMRTLALYAALGLLAGCTAAPEPTSEVDTAGPVVEAETIPTAALAEDAEVTLVKLETTKGDIYIEVHPDWAPRGSARFLELVKAGYYDGVKWFRVLDNFMAQTGMAGNPALNAQWKSKTISDDPVIKSNDRGYVTFATSGPNSRTTQIFINFKDNSFLDASGFTPFGKVVKGMDVVDSLYSGYGEGAPQGRGPSQMMIAQRGNEYLDDQFPKLDAIKKATIVKGVDEGAAAPAAEKSDG